jgi:hypothetical protein
MFRGPIELYFFPKNLRSFFPICLGTFAEANPRRFKRPIGSHTNLDHCRLGLQLRGHKRFRCRRAASEPTLTRSAGPQRKDLASAVADPLL